MKRNFKRAVAQARSGLEAVRMPAEAADRVLQAVKRGRRESAGKPISFGALGRVPNLPARIGLVSATAGAFAVVALVFVAFHGAPARAPRLSMPEGIEALVPSPDLEAHVATEDPAVAVDRGTLELRVAHWGRVVLHAGATLRRVAGGVELARGAAEFEVDKRAPSLGPTFVRTRQGTIEITGTRFFVTQSPSGGTVRLDEGSIRFRALDGRTVALVPGQSLSWPLPPAAAPPTAPATGEGPRSPAEAAVAEPQPPTRAPVQVTVAAPQPPARLVRKTSPTKADTRRAAAPATPDEMVDRIASLRASGRYADLAEELAAAIEREPRARTRERLSFELGSDLSYHLDDRARACAHWAKHLRRFPAGRYTQEAADALRSLKCPQAEPEP